MKKPTTDETGKWGEKIAVRMLKRKRYRILGRRVRVGARDEIDIVARDGAVLVFVEVKTRRSERFGRPASAVKSGKRHLMSRAAVRYLKGIKNPRVFFRFDIVEIVGEVGNKQPVIRHLENAFQLDRRYSLPS